MLSKYHAYRESYPEEFRDFITKQAILEVNRLKEKGIAIDANRIISTAEVKGIASFELHLWGYTKADGSFPSRSEFRASTN
ncbi:MAG: hypothetical protein M2R45_00684 [Verrucomicrobia subdivision 3 bacterium]|nr:hypothetical protein [Limisphaerales bacterium]MCS1414432.1 hypothetical protein [Limisphaerales bacterium]